ncbi:ATP phosphoribosyltransferase regulatory subunit [Paenibacillus yanchengensis]|uniref:ATP phosphoribosyltransferase regulatory subunit n=1 Tax=Paenibacillus yanchengensis TaxID=2035833 RepID=A0ABW4YH36_9BACL
MSKPKMFEKPHGLTDYLPGAVRKLRYIEQTVLSCMANWGYEQIVTPSMEYYDTVGMASSTSDQKLFKLLNNRGTTMVLRSDMTGPIARVVSSLLQDRQFPIRLSYHANVFRSIEEEAGREAEFFQTGVELIGDSSAEADAEVVALAIATLKAIGIDRFKIAIGHVGFMNSLFAAILADDPLMQETLKSKLLDRDYVGYRQQLQQLQLDVALKNELEGMLLLRGGKEICAKAMQMNKDETAHKAISHLSDLWDALQDYGVAEHVMIDLTMIGDFTYYTGMIFEGYAADLGFPVVSGGRYDNLLAQFGRPAAATGFALKTTRLVELLQPEEDGASLRHLIVYTDAGRSKAIAAAQQMRLQGKVVITEYLAQIPASLSVQDASKVYKGQSFIEIHLYDGEEK